MTTGPFFLIFPGMKKTVFKSKTILLAFITTVAGIVSVFHPGVDTLVAEHSGEILTTIGFLAVVLRMVTKEAVVLFADEAEPTDNIDS